MFKHFIFGCGFLGRRLAQRLLDDGQSVWTSTRSPLKAQELRSDGIQAIVAASEQWADSVADTSLPSFKSITICVGNDRRDDAEHTTVYQAATRAALILAQRFPRETCPIQFVSTTGVYARAAEDKPRRASTILSPTSTIPTTDENAPLGAERPGARASIECENLLAGQSEVPYCIFRLAGIYSLARIPNLTALQTGQPMVGSGDGLLNLIHVEDAAAILAFGTLHAPPWTVINVSDGCPIRRREFYEFLAQRYQCPAPNFTEVGGRSSPDKSIDNIRLTSWYPGPWQFPNYRVGLGAGV